VSLRPADIVIDCADNEPVVAFWSAALGWAPQPVNEHRLPDAASWLVLGPCP
jgi:hypothetical protein